MKLGSAVVLGGGFGGMAVAAALREVADRVVVIERDEVPTTPSPRRGVPQSSQLHNLLTAAQVSLGSLVPGFIDAVCAAGGTQAVVAADTQVHELGRRMPERDLGLRLLSADRPTIEHVLRQHVLDDRSVQLRDRTKVTGLHIDDGRVSGVSLESADGEGEHLEAALVVDAMGSGSKGSTWIAAAGYRVPLEELDVGQWYASCRFARPAQWRGVPRFWLVFPTPPSSRGGLISPLGQDEMYVSVSGRSTDPAPRTVEDLCQYAASLEDRSIADVLSDAQALGEPNVFRKMRASWRHYEAADQRLDGLLPIGDAFASLNPLFGQGMSVAARQAADLREALQNPEGPQSIRELTGHHLRAASSTIRRAWELGAIVDPAASPKLSPALLARVAEGLDDDAELHRRYVGMWHLIEPVESVWARANALSG